MMAEGYVLRFTKNVSVDVVAGERIDVRFPRRSLRIESSSPGLFNAILKLVSTGATEDELAQTVLESDSSTSLARLFSYLELFAEHLMLRYSIRCDHVLLATLQPTSSRFRIAVRNVDLSPSYSLSRFAYLHRQDGVLLLESPLSFAKVELHDRRAVLLITELANPRTCQSLSELSLGLPLDTVSELVGMLLGAEFASRHKPELPCGEGVILEQWEFHDLLFHSRSRLGRHANPLGGTYRFRGRLEPTPAVKPEMSADVVELFRPDLEKLQQEDPPFSYILENRRSIREYGETPITLRQIGEFLFRAARAKELAPSAGRDHPGRPYPAAGAVYELELYLCVNRCEGLTTGLYHYSATKHRLCKVSDSSDRLAELGDSARASAGIADELQVLVIVAARFQRLSWKYESIAYSLVLKDVGVLYQTMYLVATAMKLAPCGLGAGDCELFAEVTQLDYYVEASVGEFLLGSQRPNRAES